MKQFFNQSKDNATKIPDYIFCPFCGQKLNWEPKRKCSKCGFIQYKNPLPGVSVLISNSENNLLLGKRKNQLESWQLRSVNSIDSGYSDLERPKIEVNLNYEGSEIEKSIREQIELYYK